MKKLIKYTIAVFLVIAVVAYGFTLNACSGSGGGHPTLARPVVSVIEETIIIEWDEIEGASHYEIRVSRRLGCSSVREGVREWTETTFDLSSLSLSNSGHTYGVTVRAVSVTGGYIVRGPWSTSVAVTLN